MERSVEAAGDIHLSDSQISSSVELSTRIVVIGCVISLSFLLVMVTVVSGVVSSFLV